MSEQPHFATFVLSTGRCGTQWLAEVLGEIYADRLRVGHEPLHDGYCARRMLGVGDPNALAEKRARPIQEHLDGVEKTLATRSYFETGHPVWSSLPYITRRLAGRVRIVHLTRHPVPTAYSWVTHGLYVPPMLPHLPAKEFLTPFDEGVRFPEYREVWATLTPWEKCLYYWAEVQAHGLACETVLNVPWLRISYEALFAGDGLRRLVDFLELPVRDGLAPARARPVDQHRFLLSQWAEPGVLKRHARFVEVAERLGYSWADFDEEALRQRYLGR